MPQGTAEYALAASELPSIRALLTFQGKYGVSATLTNSDIKPYFDSLIKLSSFYPQITNTNFKTWFEQLFSQLMATDTVYNQKLPALYLAYAFGEYCKAMEPDWMGEAPDHLSGSWIGGWWQSFLHGEHVLDGLNSWQEMVNGGTTPAWGAGMTPRTVALPPRPAAPPSWKDATDTLLSQWGDDQPPTNIISTQEPNFDDVTHIIWPPRPSAYQATVLQNWTDFPTVASSTLPVFQSQSDKLKAMLHPDALAASDYFFLLHLLIAECSRTDSTETQLVSASSASSEYPNDTFINQLVYLVLMYLANPDGGFKMINADLQTMVSDLKACISSTNPASAAISTAFDTHLTLLEVDSAYPMDDPNNAAVNFDDRLTDTLSALDSTRIALRTSVTS